MDRLLQVMEPIALTLQNAKDGTSTMVIAVIVSSAEHVQWDMSQAQIDILVTDMYQPVDASRYSERISGNVSNVHLEQSHQETKQPACQSQHALDSTSITVIQQIVSSAENAHRDTFQIRKEHHVISLHNIAAVIASTNKAILKTVDGYAKSAQTIMELKMV
jgi:hypothetical protein